MPKEDKKYFFKSNRFRFLGLDVQDIIRYFFGGNASVAVIVLCLICIFLVKEAWSFFPDHHKDLKIYRKSGLELVDYLRVQTDQQKKVISQLNQALNSEVTKNLEHEDVIICAYDDLKREIEEKYSKQYERLNSLEEWLEDNIEDKSQRLEIEKKISETKKLITDSSLIDLENRKNYKTIKNLKEDDWEIISSAIKKNVTFQERIPSEIQEIQDLRYEKYAKGVAQNSEFKQIIKEAKNTKKTLQRLWSDLRDVVEKTKSEAVAFKTSKDRKEAILLFAEQAKDAEQKEAKENEAKLINMDAPEYQLLNEPVYEKIPECIEASSQMVEKLSVLLKDLPILTTYKAQKHIVQAKKELVELDKLTKDTIPKIEKWNHQKPYSFLKSVGAFFFGKYWITNSSWHDFYGVLPLFTGSLLISLVAIVVSVPFSVGAAIYVNQLASIREQNFIKPVIEFIGAIPSVVLGFFGIVVFGSFLRDVSQIEWLAWIPGFPMAERLNILNAGLLLALMAVPTIFTLSEDALNNVPKAFSEGSLALGATKIQTILGVIVPTAISGIVAAILLGFGRIIGETMVVLLVAGNKIAIPDFTLGLGVVTQPTHTMTGITAQELGEVSSGSLHWRALFVVGMILFFIALIINILAQKVIHKFKKV